MYRHAYFEWLKLCFGCFASQHTRLCSAHDVTGSGRTGKVQTMFLAIVRFIQSWKDYNSTLRELNALSDRELADIGVSRSDIPRVAWNTATSG
jgi:uncharacterized protein YjiS (DUF1127 family)